MNKTTVSFVKDISRTPVLKIKLLDNLVSQQKDKFILDLFGIVYDFKKKSIKLEYYVVDKEYPDAIFSFEEFINLLNNS